MCVYRSIHNSLRANSVVVVLATSARRAVVYARARRRWKSTRDAPIRRGRQAKRAHHKRSAAMRSPARDGQQRTYIYLYICTYMRSPARDRQQWTYLYIYLSRSGSPNFRSPTAAHRAATALSMVCATTQPTALPIRCSGACVLQKRFVPQRSNLLQRGAAWRGATEPAAAQHVLQRGATCCNRPQPAATCCSAVQRVHRQSGPMQRSTTCCNRPQFAAMGHSALQPVAAIATQCSPLQQQTTGICNRPRPVATDHGPLQ
jgi:hypothetical protein